MAFDQGTGTADLRKEVVFFTGWGMYLGRRSAFYIPWLCSLADANVSTGRRASHRPKCLKTPCKMVVS